MTSNLNRNLLNMIITIGGPGRRKGLFFWVSFSAGILLLVNLFLYFTVYDDSVLNNNNQAGAIVSNEKSDSDLKNGAKSLFSSANNLLNAVTGSGDDFDVTAYKDLTKDKRNKRLRSYLPASFYSGEEFESLREQDPRVKVFDRRMLPAFWLHLINKNLQSGSDSLLPSKFKLPFNWDLLNDYAVKIQKMKYFDKVVKGKMNCDLFRKIAPDGMPNSFLQDFCLNYNYEDPNFVNDYNVPFLVIRKIDQYLSDVDWRKLYGMLYSLTNSPIPENVMFLGGVGSEGRSMLVPLEKVSNGKNNLASLGEISLQSYYTELANEFIEDQVSALPSFSRSEILEHGISVVEEWARFNKLIASKDLKVEEELIYFPSSPVILGAGTHAVSLKPVDLSPDDFKFYLPDEQEKLAKLIEEAPAGANTQQLENLNLWANLVLDPKFEEPWYYGIPSIKGEHLDHYDWRFFSVFTLKEDQELHTAILHRLSRVWFRICSQFDVPSWMNHGPLIGWYWSGMTLPYDYDLDLQMPVQALHRISKFLNNTLVYDFTNEEEYINDDVKIDNKAELGIRSYLIDIDPLYFDRNQVRTLHNDLDARLIDTETGIYIDLTAVSEFHSGHRYNLEEEKKYFAKSDYNGYRITVPAFYDQFKDPESGKYKQDRSRGCVMKDEYVKKIDSYISEKNVKDSRLEDSPTAFLNGYVHDKHFHTYKFDELSPLIPTIYENSLSYLPSNWHKNSMIEYQGDSCLRNSYYSKHHFLGKLLMWVGYKDCPIWNEDTGAFKDGMNENDVASECLATNEKLETQYKRSVHYLNMHNIYRKKLLKDQGDVLKFDEFEKNITPLLKKFDGQLFVPEPFVERTLYA